MPRAAANDQQGLMGCTKVDAVATTPCFGFAEIGKASWLPSPITGWINGSAFLPNKSPLRRHPLPPLPDQVLPKLLGVEAQHPAAMPDQGPA
jgi:hypothetical protein